MKLEQNYRSTKRILRVADQLIGYNQRRKQKGLFTENDEGQSVRLVNYATQRDEAESIAAYIADEIRAGRRRPRDFAIFYRVNALSRSLEYAMRDQGVPYQMVNGLEFYQRNEIKDVLAYLHLINNPRDDVSLLRVINNPPRQIGKSTLARLAEHAARYGLSLLDAARESGLIESLNKRAAVAVAKFVALYDQLAVLSSAPVEEIMGHVLAESGYKQFLEDSESEEDQDRLANIEELLTAAREFDEHHSGDGAAGSVSRGSGAGERYRRLGGRKRPRHADDAARREGIGVSGRVHCRSGRRPAAARAQPQRSRDAGRRATAAVRRHHPGREELQLSLATNREFRGQRRRTVPSQFLMEMPRGEMDVVGPPSAVPEPGMMKRMRPMTITSIRFTRTNCLGRPTSRPISHPRNRPTHPPRHRARWPSDRSRPPPNWIAPSRPKHRGYRPSRFTRAWSCAIRSTVWAKSWR